MSFTRSLAAITMVAALAACAGNLGSGPLPGSGPVRIADSTLRAVPIYSPSPTPDPGLLGGLLGGVLGLVSSLTCGVTAGLTCHILGGAGPQGLPAGTAASKLPGLHPADLQSAYALASATGGAGQTIGIVVAYDDPSLEKDLGVYRSTFGLGACTTANGCFKKITASSRISGNQGWGQEASLDVDIASAVCPHCAIVVVEAASDEPSALLAAAKTAVAEGATVVSNSYSVPESSSENDAAYAIGVPFVFGAGDSGPGAEWPAASSHVIAVGGTSLKHDSSARGWTETVWTGSGGGCSAYVAKPAWQPADGCPNRTANDISAFADPNPGVAVYDSYLSSKPGWRTYGGTSISAPIVAGAIALAGNAAQFSDASALYSAASGLNRVGVGGYAPQPGNGSPNATAGL